MTPARLAALGISLALLIGAMWLVFVGIPKSPAPAPTAVAGVPSTGPGSTAPTTSGNPLASDVPGSPGTSPGSVPTAPPLPADPLLKVVPAHSVDPAQLTGYIWPVKHGLITTRFAPLAPTDGGFVMIDGIAYHDGLDLATHCDDHVRSAHDGTVLYAGRDFDPYLGYQGNAEAIYDRLKELGHTNEQPIVVVIDDGNGYRSVYVHLNQADVESGQVVKAGDDIGLEGATGFASGCHLHYTIIRMDGGWQPVVSRLLQFGYPPLVRERVNPLDILAWGDPDAPQRLQDKVNPPTPITSPEPGSSSESSSSPDISTEPSSTPTN